MLFVREYSTLVCFVLVVFSCETKETTSVTAGQPQKQIRFIIESIHNPIEQAGGVEYRSEIVEHSYVTKSVFNRNGALLSKEQFDSRSNITEKVIYKYRQDNLIETVSYQAGSVTGKLVNKFNIPNKLMESHEFDAYDKNIGKQLIRYDNNGNRSVVAHRLVNGDFVRVSEFFFNERGQNVENDYFSDEILTRKEINRFDQQGNRIEIILFDPSMKEERITYIKYDSLHRSTETVVLNSSLIIESREAVVYDDEHNIIRRFTYGLKGNLKEYESHTYEYDEAGNWTKDVMFMDKKPVEVRIRKIEYY